MASRTVIVAGATGLVGREILAGLLADPSVAAVHSLGRRMPAEQHPKLMAHVVDFAANLAVAKAALAEGAKRVGLVSAMGADSKSKVFYSRVKGELEDALAAMAFEGMVFARPSLLVGDREVLGQPTRQGEVLGSALSKVVGFLIPADYKPISASAVASALLSAVPSAKGKTVLLFGAMRR